MSYTAFSISYGVELDAKQLLKRRNVISSVDAADFGLPPSEREWMRSDLLCPSCRCAGASLVRSDVAKSGRGNTRQIHFRFLNADGRTAHREGCDFYPLDDEPGLVRGVDVAFSANDKDTKLIRVLVCKAFASGKLSKPDLFRLRTWFLAQRTAHTFQVRATPEMVEWLFQLQRLRGVMPLRFEQPHAMLPGFTVVHAARRDLAAHYGDFLKTLPMHLSAPARDSAVRLARTRPGEHLIDMSPLRPLFDKTCVLAVLIARLGVLPLSKPVRGESFVAGPPRALLAFSAALLFVSDWNVEKALSVFAEIHAQPVPEDLAQANIMGLNPFHDFAALEALRFASGCMLRGPGVKRIREGERVHKGRIVSWSPSLNLGNVGAGRARRLPGRRQRYR